MRLKVLVMVRVLKLSLKAHNQDERAAKDKTFKRELIVGLIFGFLTLYVAMSQMIPGVKLPLPDLIHPGFESNELCDCSDSADFACRIRRS